MAIAPPKTPQHDGSLGPIAYTAYKAALQPGRHADSAAANLQVLWLYWGHGNSCGNNACRIDLECNMPSDTNSQAMQCNALMSLHDCCAMRTLLCHGVLGCAGKHLDDAQRTLGQYGVAYWHRKFPDWPIKIRRH